MFRSAPPFPCARLQCIDSWQYRHECKEGQQSDDRGSHASVREVLVEEGVPRIIFENKVYYDDVTEPWEDL